MKKYMLLIGVLLSTLLHGSTFAIDFSSVMIPEDVYAQDKEIDIEDGTKRLLNIMPGYEFDPDLRTYKRVKGYRIMYKNLDEGFSAHWNIVTESMRKEIIEKGIFDDFFERASQALAPHGNIKKAIHTPSPPEHTVGSEYPDEDDS